jgi:hypothetical protein
MPACHEPLISSLVHDIAYGAMIALALSVGIVTDPCCEDADPIGVVELGTLASHPSSCRDSVGPSSVYQDPACEGWRMVGAMRIETQGVKYLNCVKALFGCSDVIGSVVDVRDGYRGVRDAGLSDRWGSTR